MTAIDIEKINNGANYLLRFEYTEYIIYGFAKSIREKGNKMLVDTTPSIEFSKGTFKRGTPTYYVSNISITDEFNKKEFNKIKVVTSQGEINYFINLLKRVGKVYAQEMNKIIDIDNVDKYLKK